VDYDGVCAALASLDGETYRYGEELVSEALQILESQFPLGSWRVELHKPFPPCPLPVDEASFTAFSEPDD
jgi:hypothetical protein